MSVFAHRLSRRFLVLVVGIACGICLLPGRPAVSDSGDSADLTDRRIQNAIEVLAHIPTGKRLLIQAQTFWKLSRTQDLVQNLKWGAASKTDAVLTRHFNPKTGQESRERQVT